MGEIKVFPSVFVQQFASGAKVEGVAPTPTTSDSGETLYRGRYRQFSDLTNGGLFGLPAAICPGGFRVMSILMSLPGITAINVFVNDANDKDFFAGSPSINSGNSYAPYLDMGLLIPPSCKLKIVGTGTLSGAGRIMIVTEQGWGNSVFVDSPSLGACEMPPTMKRP